jgi:hypothetical protein
MSLRSKRLAVVPDTGSFIVLVSLDYPSRINQASINEAWINRARNYPFPGLRGRFN